MSELITVTINNHVADVRLNRADKMNALNLAMFKAINELGKQLSTNRDIRAVVLSGEGKAFCAGLDLANFTDPDFIANPFGEGRSGYYPNFYQSPAFIWKAIPVPVICALQGVAFGGGLQIALGADIRIAHPQTQLSIMEIKWGLIPDMSASQTLRDLVRLDVAKELTFSGRVVGADEALAVGLITAIDEQPREAALAMASEIASRNPDAISYSKYLLDNSWHGEQQQGLQTEERLQARLLKSSNQIEAVTAAMEKRPPQFQPREVASYQDLDL